MERFLFSKIETWLVLVIVAVLLAVMVLFGAVVRHVAFGGERFGAIGRAAFAVAAVPDTVESLLDGSANMGLKSPGPDRFEGRAGWSWAPGAPEALADGYLLFSRFDGDAGRAAVELVDPVAGKAVYRLEPDAEVLTAGFPEGLRFAAYGDWTHARFRAIHPIPTPNGDLIIKDHRAPLMRITPCGGLVWRRDDAAFHHATEIDPDGGYWVSPHLEPTPVAGLSNKVLDNGIMRIDEDGNTLFSRSLAGLLLDRGLGYMIFDHEKLDPDPMHLNDIQPVPGDGPFWRRGDVFLSLRHLSMIMLYRPATDEIVWMKRGPWSAQHDVDVLDENRIAIFDNASLNLGDGFAVQGNNRVLVYDFRDETISDPYGPALQALKARTASEGLSSILDGGRLMFEETEQGRLMILDADGALLAENVNRAEDGELYQLGWSRWLSRTEGDAWLANIAARGPC